MTDFNTRIQPFLDHYQAFKENEKIEGALQTFVELLHPDNRAYIVDNPFKMVVERNLERDDPELYEWYSWWLYESGGGRHGQPGADNEFSFTEPIQSRKYRASEFVDNPTALFRVIVPYLDGSVENATPIVPFSGDWWFN